MDEVCGVWKGFPRPGLCCGRCQCFEIAQLSQIKAFSKAFIDKNTFPVRHRTPGCINNVVNCGASVAVTPLAPPPDPPVLPW